MGTEPDWQLDPATPGVWRPTPPTRTAEEEKILTDMARNYLTGRRWLCRFAHACVWLGVTIGTLAAGWDHLTAAAERIAKQVGH